MKLLRLVLMVFLVLSLLLWALPGMASAQVGSDFSQERILVKFRAGTDEFTKHDISWRHGDREDKDISPLGVKVITVAAGKVEEKLSAYRSEKSIEYAEPDYIAKAIGTPSDPAYVNQWGLAKIQAPQAWDITTGSSVIKIAILDTGVDSGHPDLAGKIVMSQNFTTSNTTNDLYGHGTHVAGIAAAVTNNVLGIAGLGYNSSIMNVKVLDDTGSGSYSSVASGITWAADNGAKVINLSLGGGSASTTLESAVNYAWSKGVVVVAAAGNNGNSSRSYPGYYTNAIAVAATDQNDLKASFSTYGTWVDIAAPGVNIYSTLPTTPNQIGATNYGYLSGTSMATPFVSGLAALVWATPYGTTNLSVRNRIQSTAVAVAGTGTYWQNGRINAFNAVSASVTPPPAKKLHIAGIAMTLQNVSRNTRANASISIVDSAGLPVSGALVSGHWTGATTDVDTGLTGTTGKVTLQSNQVRRPPSGTTYTFTVDSVTLSGWTYDPAANLIASNSIKVP